MAASSSSWSYDVFLSFRGTDTRRGFTSNLYSALRRTGIHAFMDDAGVERGGAISDSLKQAIERSRIALVILSPDYASSRWCLEELVKIMECQRSQAQVVIPIFYNVDPSHVRRQRGRYGEAMERHERRLGKENDRVLRWRQALTDAAHLAGYHLANRLESQLIETIIEGVSKKLDVGQLFVAEHPVGIELRVHELTIEWSKTTSQKALIIGVWGMGGLGKTTVAKAIYNKIGCHHQFQARSFLTNIRENSKHANLQKQLIFDITKIEAVSKIPHIGRGRKIIQERFRNIQAFVVLDDVDRVHQLDALCGSPEWFCPGSIIIITTRDKHLLDVLKADHKYTVKEMNDMESLELFSWHAFKQTSPPSEEFSELSKGVVKYCSRLPLALEILGSFLRERTVEEWKAAMSKLETIPNKDIHAMLRISYDGLNDYMEKDIFLDICCFFINKDRSYVTQILDGCGLHATCGLPILVERNLLRVGRNNEIEIHDLLQEMGKEIIRESSPKEPRHRTRLWSHEDVFDVLTENTGTEAIEGLSLKVPETYRECVIDSKAFKEMKKLRLLQLDYVNLKGDYNHLSKKLRWLCWHGFPSKYIPNNLYQKNLVALDFKYSNLKVVWKEPQLLEMLKTLDLSNSHSLKETPDFAYLPSLEMLVMEDCRSLILIHESIGDLRNLLHVNLKDCKSLRDLPKSMYKLKSLKTLILSGCSLIDHLEEEIEQMESLTTLMADNTAITKVPFSLARLGGLVHGYVSFPGHEGRAQDIFPSLIRSWMSRNNVPQSSIEEFAQILSSIGISVGGNSGFMELESTRDAPQISSMEPSGSSECHDPLHFDARPPDSIDTLLLQLGVYGNADVLKEQFSQGWDDSQLPDDWFIYKGEGHSVVFKVPQVKGCDLKAMLLNVVFSYMDYTTPQFLINVRIINHTKTIVKHLQGDSATFHEDAERQSIISIVEPGDLVELLVLSIGPQFLVKKTAAYLNFTKTDDFGL